MAHPDGKRAGNVPPVRVLAWELTRACNLSCPYCRAASVETDPDAPSVEEAMAILDDIATLGRPLLILSGGEPLLSPALFPIAERAGGMGFPVAVATNGTLVDDKAAARLAAAGVRRVSVSLDFPDAARHDAVRGRGAFEAATGGIDRLKSAGLAFQVNMTVTVRNAGEIAGMLSLAEALGAKALHFFFVVDVGRAQGRGEGLSGGEYERVLEGVAHLEATAQIEMRVTCAPQYRRVRQELGLDAEEGPGSSGCLAGKGFLFISARGEVKPCGYFDMVLGRAVGGRLAGLWADNEVLRRLRSGATLKGRCGTCGYAAECGGCRARALSATGDFLSEDPACGYNS